MSFPWWLLVLYLARGADFASTEMSLAAGAVELNPLLDVRAVRVASSIAAPVLIELGARALERKRHPRWAKAVRIAAIAAWGYAAAHNLRQARARSQ